MIEIRGEPVDRAEEILTADAQNFLVELHRRFNPRRLELLDRRKRVQKEIDAGKIADFLPDTKSIREGNWKIAPVPADLQDRRIEITGPVDRKMVINALNSGAKLFMADFEDSNSPTWFNNISGQVNLADAIRQKIPFDSPEGKSYRLNEKVATLLVRPRGWHLNEKHIVIDGQPMSGSLFDFGLFFFHNARELLNRGSGPYFYLPKMESHLEARLWNDVFNFAQDYLKIPRGKIKATVLIETILASFEMDEILYELREHSAGLNCGRWDYIFSVIKKFAQFEKFVLPDRSLVTMTSPFMRAYSLLCIKTCHRRGAHAMGGMAAQIPIKNDPVANDAALAKVRADKLREASDGHDGTWVAHPGLVPIAMEIFDAKMPSPNQLGKMREDVNVTARDLLTMPDGAITEDGLRANITIGLRYLESWLRGNGCVPIFSLMEDAATAEISRSQVWQWIKHKKFDVATVRKMMREEMDKIRSAGNFPALDQAAKLFDQLATAEKFVDFLTLPAYEMLD